MCDVQSQNGWLLPYKIHTLDVRARHGFLRPQPPVKEDTERPERVESFEVGRESSSLAMSIEIGEGEGEGEGDGAAGGGARTSSGRLRARAVVGAATLQSSGRRVRRPMNARSPDDARGRPPVG